MENGRNGLEHGDRIVAARDIDTTQGLHIPQGAEGTVAEDRGLNLVVFFADDAIARVVDQQDVVRATDLSAGQSG
jgi:hypothetical protein